MLRLVAIVVAAAVLGAAAAWLADHPGTLVVTWQGWQVRGPVAALALAALAVALLTWFLHGLYLWLRQGPGRYLAGRRLRRREQGYKALSEGLVAIAAGDAARARRLARRAGELLDRAPLTLLLEAQSAQLAGDEATAAQAFRHMLTTPETELLALRGLVNQATKAGDLADALSHARRARALRPDSPWAIATVAELAARTGAYGEAEAAVAEAERRKLVPRDEGERRRAALLTARAREERARGDTQAARDAVREAHRRAPDLVPAAVLAAELAAADRPGAAAKVIEETWARAPHPDLAAAYASGGARDPLARLKALEKLARSNPDHPETRLALAAAAVNAALWGEARRHLEPLVAPGGQPNIRACRLMAEIEERERDDAAAARRWLARAATEATDAAWLCGACAAAQATWAPACPSCGAIATLAWRTQARAVPPPVALPAAAAS